jgi:hypothetical protein
MLVIGQAGVASETMIEDDAIRRGRLGWSLRMEGDERSGEAVRVIDVSWAPGRNTRVSQPAVMYPAVG